MNYYSDEYPSVSPEAEEYLTRRVIARRVVAWLIDLVLIGCLVAALWVLCLGFGILTLGLGWPVFGVLPFVPFCYHFLFLAGPLSATPGQALLGLVVRRNDDLSRPTPLQALLSTGIYYATLATSGLLLLLTLFTVRKRTLHDLLSGLVVVRTRAFDEFLLGKAPGVWNPSYR
ncbi:MAG: RDD family protein [Acetobacteraceae bacterium]|nr:RDD family protein [Acetobacteraceae bacterium]MBV8592290.1 RDD family protein [Acetobacteraceae bacterium]